MVTSSESKVPSANKLRLPLTYKGVLGLERLNLVAVKVVFPGDAALTFLISSPSSESLL